jgi:hypothetical protein
MKLLMMFAEKFAYITAMKTLESVPDIVEEESFEHALVGFIQVEAHDEERLSEVETKLIKQLKWAARKNGTTAIVLHSFAHLSESKASPDFTKQLFSNAERRLFSADYQVHQTPFGYFLDLDIHAPGKPSARIFKDL